MKALRFNLLSAFLISICTTIVSAQNVNVSGSNGADGTYGNLGAAFTAINNNTQSGNNITITIVGNTTESTTATLNQGGWATLTIQPSGARTISGNISGNALITLNGADNVTINGLNTGGNSLTIVNTSTSNVGGTSTIRLVSDATNNTITNCTILGASTTATTTNGGTIWISTAAGGGVGNDNNKISNNRIGPVGTNFPTKAIFALGSTTNTTVYNSGITISGNEIFNYFAPAAASAGIYIANGNNNWTISNNKFYQTAARTQTSGVVHAAIQVAGSTGNTTHTFTNNTIGYSSGSGTGTYQIQLASGGRFVGILVSSAGGGGTYNFQGNTITAISVSGTGRGTTATTAPFVGIVVAAPVGATYNGNVIGSATTAGAISFTTNATVAAHLYGIFHAVNTNANIIGNIVAGINASNINATPAAIVFYGLRVTANANITGNTVGTTSAQISVSSLNGATRVIGISGETGLMQITANTVRNLTTNSTYTAATGSAVGILVNASAISGHTVSSNQVENVINTNTTAAVTVVGIVINAGTGTNVVERNRINAIAAPNTTGNAAISGIYVQAGTTTYRNNMISLGANMSNNPRIYGIQEINTSNNFYHNSIYISGVETTSNNRNSWAFFSAVTNNTRNYRNNIFFNGRSRASGTGKHYAIQVGGTGVNPPGLTSNNNILFANGTGGVLGFYNGADRNTLTAWQSATGQDSNSISANPQFLSTTDLHLQIISPALSQGANLGVVVNDYDSDPRPSSSNPDIGADQLVRGNSIPGGTYYNVGVSNDGGLGGNVTVSGYVYFGSGRLNTGGNTLTFECDATVYGVSSSGYVIGNVAKKFCATGSFTYPIGSSDPNEYTPVIANVTALGQNPSTLAASVTDSPMTGLVPSRSLSRYWTLTENGDITANLTFQYLDSGGEDVPPTANENLFVVFRKSGSTITNVCQTLTCSISASSNTFSVNGVTNFSDWTAGELVATSGPADVRGRVVTREGRGIAGVRITVISENGEVRVVQTNPFGYYSLRGLPSGQTYTFTLTHKVYRFSQSPIVRSIMQDEEINFTADELE